MRTKWKALVVALSMSHKCCRALHIRCWREGQTANVVPLTGTLHNCAGCSFSGTASDTCEVTPAFRGTGNWMTQEVGVLGWKGTAMRKSGLLRRRMVSWGRRRRQVGVVDALGGAANIGFCEANLLVIFEGCGHVCF